MSVPNITAEHLNQLKDFIVLCKMNPSILHRPELSFMKAFIEHFGGVITNEKTYDSNTTEFPSECKMEEAQVTSVEESEESDLELDMTGVIEPDTDEPQKMGNPTLQPTEEEIAESQTKRSEAVSAFVEKDYKKAINLYTEAIQLNPQAALLYTKRGQIYLLLNKPNACVRDCDRALQLNPDSAAAHKFRGRAYHLLGKWEEAANDLRLACKFDLDEQADEWLREVTPNARKIEEHKRKKERKMQERLQRQKQENLKKARESVKAREDNTRTCQTEWSGVSGIPNIYEIFQKIDRDILQDLKDPEIFEAYKDISAHPANLFKYEKNPKIMTFVDKAASRFVDMLGGDAVAGVPTAAAGVPQFTSSEHHKPQDDVALD